MVIVDPVPQIRPHKKIQKATSDDEFEDIIYTTQQILLV